MTNTLLGVGGNTKASRAKLGSLKEERFEKGYSFRQLHELLCMVKLRPPGPSLVAWRKKRF